MSPRVDSADSQPRAGAWWKGGGLDGEEPADENSGQDAVSNLHLTMLLATVEVTDSGSIINSQIATDCFRETTEIG